MCGLVRARYVIVEEAVAMFLHILAFNLNYKVIKFAYYRSKETIVDNLMVYCTLYLK